MKTENLITILVVSSPLIFFVMNAVFWQPYKHHEDLRRENIRLQNEIRRLRGEPPLKDGDVDFYNPSGKDA